MRVDGWRGVTGTMVRWANGMHSHGREALTSRKLHRAGAGGTAAGGAAVGSRHSSIGSKGGQRNQRGNGEDLQLWEQPSQIRHSCRIQPRPASQLKLLQQRLRAHSTAAARGGGGGAKGRQIVAL